MARTKRARKRLVLDIGSSAIRLCELTPTRNGFQLSKYLQRELPVEPSTDEDTRRQVQAQALRELLQQARVRSRKCVFAVPGQAVFARTRALPPVPEYKVTQIVRYEIQQQIPFSLDQIALDYQLLSRTESGGYEVLMAAIKVDVVERRLDLLKQAKCTVDTVDVAPVAAYNWLKATGHLGEQGECVAMVDIGASTTDIVIENGGQFRYPRSVNMGGNDITQAIAESFNVSFAEAERMKRERGFAPTGNPEQDSKGGEVIGRVLGRIAVEINKSFSYYRAQPGGANVTRVVLAGGGACLRNIVPYLQRALNVEVRIAQPLSGIAVAPAAQAANEHPEQATVALGLAMRTCGQPAIELNLIPPRILEGARRREQFVYWTLVFATITVALACIIPIRASQDKIVQDRINLYRQVLREYDPALEHDPSRQSEYETQLQTVKTRVEAYKRQVQRMDQAIQDRYFWLNLLQAINDARPTEGDIWISSIESTKVGGSMRRGFANIQTTGMGMGMGMSGGYWEDEYDEHLWGEDELTAGGMSMGMGRGGMRMGMGATSLSYEEVLNAYETSDMPYFNTGFPGIQPLVEQSMFGGMGMGGMGTMGGGMGTMGGMGGFGGRAGMLGVLNFENMRSRPIIRPNGATILGYARRIETILSFVENLERSPMTIDGGVHFDPASADRHNPSVLYNAAIAGTIGGRAGGLGGGMGSGATTSSSAARYEDDDDYDYERRAGMGGGGGFGGGYGGGYGGGGAGNIIMQQLGNNVVSFKIDLQFSGVPADATPPDPMQPAAGTMGTAPGTPGTGLGTPSTGAGTGTQQPGQGLDLFGTRDAEDF